MFDRLAIPIVQAPMLGAAREAMALAVSRAGGLGSLAAAGLSGAAIRSTCATLRAGTDRPFAVNLFIQPRPEPDAALVAAAIARLRPWRARYGLADQVVPDRWCEDFDDQFSALLDAAPPAASFTFGCLAAARTRALQSRGTFVIGTATSVAEAKAWAAAGADAICAQGAEAGGHRGSFLGAGSAHAAIGTMALVRTILAAVDLPVVAAGGIGDGPGIAAALMLGATGVQLGTAYLLSDESTINATWRAAIEGAPDDPTALTRAISGRPARGIENAFMREMRPVEADIAPYPVQNALTQDLRAAAARAGSPDVLSLWAGQGVKLARRGAAGDLTCTLWAEACDAFAARASRHRPIPHTGASP